MLELDGGEALMRMIARGLIAALCKGFRRPGSCLEIRCSEDALM